MILPLMKMIAAINIAIWIPILDALALADIASAMMVNVAMKSTKTSNKLLSVLMLST